MSNEMKFSEREEDEKIVDQALLKSFYFLSGMGLSFTAFIILALISAIVLGIEGVA